MYHAILKDECKVIRSHYRQVQQANAPTLCSSCYGSLKILLRRSSSCKALRVRCRLSHCLQFTFLSFGQLPVSCLSTLFITSSVLFHYVSFTSSAILHLQHGVFLCCIGSTQTLMCRYKSYSSLHCIPLPSSFIHFSRLQSTRCP